MITTWKSNRNHKNHIKKQRIYEELIAYKVSEKGGACESKFHQRTKLII